MASITREVDPISRIEGHLGAKLTVDDATNKITAVQVHGNLWRGFENFLIGRQPNDAITFTQRICGVCPVPHGQTATFTTEAAIGYTGTNMFQTPDASANPGIGVPTKAIHVRNLVLGSEFLMSSLTHFYHLAAPSYIQGPAIPPWTPYFGDGYYHETLQASGHGTAGVVTGPAPYNDDYGILPLESKGFSADLWSAVIKQYLKALRIRRLALEGGALFAGRMPMTSSYVAGGVTTNKNEDLTIKCTKFRALIKEIGDFVVKEYVPLVLALGKLYPDYDNKHNTGKGYGAGCGNFLAWGGFPIAGQVVDPQGKTSNHFERGYVFNAGGYYTTGAQTSGSIVAADVLGVGDASGSGSGLREHITNSRYKDDTAYNYTGTGVSDPSKVTRTVPDRDIGYSYLKAPRFKNKPCEVGPLARLVVMNLYPIDKMTATAQKIVDGVGSSALQQLAATVYVRADGSTGTGLNPEAVSADLAVALIREGLATLKVNVNLSTLVGDASGGVHVWTVENGAAIDNVAYKIGIEHPQLSGTEIGIAYGLAGATIHGVVKEWIVDLQCGLSTMDRIRARALESIFIAKWMIGGPSFNVTTRALEWVDTTSGWIDQLKDRPVGADTYAYTATPTTHAFGFGAAEAPRGALMHMCTLDNGKISAYQCIVPTTWNASPADVSNVKGPIEQAIVPPSNGGGDDPQTEQLEYRPPTGAYGGKNVNQSGAYTTVTEGGLEALRIAQSFDPCIACAVH